MREWFKKHQPQFEGEILFEEPLVRHTYYRIGGPAQIIAIPKSLGDLSILAQVIQEQNVSYFLLGLGSNVLASDQGYPGLVIKLQRIDLSIERRGNTIRTGSSVAVSSFLRRASQEGWGGFEFLTGIPGSMGGAVAMNAGTHLGETQEALKAIDVFSIENGSKIRLEKSDLKFEYRRNLFLNEGDIVLAADWSFREEDPRRVKEQIDQTLQRRKATQPIDYPSCGSVFKNPKASGLSAWQVIEKLGLKGHQIGDAQFSSKHGNFIVNLGKATAGDVKGLIELAKDKARSELSIELEEEVKYLGKL